MPRVHLDARREVCLCLFLSAVQIIGYTDLLSIIGNENANLAAGEAIAITTEIRRNCFMLVVERGGTSAVAFVTFSASFYTTRS